MQVLMFQRYTKMLVILNLQKRKWNNISLENMLSLDNFQSLKISPSIIVLGIYGFSFITKYMMYHNSNIQVIFMIRDNIFRRHWDISVKCSHGRYFVIWRYQSFCQGSGPNEKLLHRRLLERWRNQRTLGPICKEEGAWGTGPA